MKCTHCGNEVRTDKVEVYENGVKITIICTCGKPDIHEVLPLNSNTFKVLFFVNEKLDERFLEG